MLDGPQNNLTDGGDSVYYDLPEGATRLHDVIRDKEMTWNQANIFKAAYRWAEKPDLMYNLQKILWFVQDEIKHQETLRDQDNIRSERLGRGTEVAGSVECPVCEPVEPAADKGDGCGSFKRSEN